MNVKLVSKSGNEPIAKSVRKASVYTHWLKQGRFDVGLSYGPEGIVVVYHEPKRSFFQFILEGKQRRFWVESNPSRKGLVRLARHTLREALCKNQERDCSLASESYGTIK